MAIVEGFKNEALRAALATALGGKATQLHELLCRYGGGHDLKPNLRLAAAFGAEVADAPAAATRLLARLGADDAAPDTPAVFLPIAAAYGWVARIAAGHDAAVGWAALAELAADERAPVRVGTREALLAFAVREHNAQELIAAATGWLDAEDRDARFGAAAVVAEVLADRRALSGAGDPQALLDYLSRAVREVVEAPRSAERSETRRRLLLSLPGALTTAVAGLRAGDIGPAWFQTECENQRHPDVRHAFSDAILALRNDGQGQGAALSQRLRQALQGSAKPPRDPTRIRKGQGRGKASRRVR